jgi:hypothetical protein
MPKIATFNVFKFPAISALSIRGSIWNQRNFSSPIYFLLLKRVDGTFQKESFRIYFLQNWNLSEWNLLEVIFQKIYFRKYFQQNWNLLELDLLEWNLSERIFQKIVLVKPESFRMESFRGTHSETSFSANWNLSE